MKKRYVLFVSMLLILTFVGAVTFNEDFSQGTFFRAFYNSSGFVQLNVSQGFYAGNFSSRIINATFNSTWQNISWKTEVCYDCELPNNGSLESGDFVSLVNMTGNVLLAHMNEQSGNITDYSIYSHIGIVRTTGAGAFEGPEYNSPGRFNTSLHFDTGAGSNGDFVNFSSPSQLNNFGNQLTLEAWVNPETFPSSPTIIDKGPNLISFYITDGATNLLTLSLDTSVGSPVIYSGTRDLSTSRWYHLVATYNGSQVRLYVNGLQDGTTGARTGNVSTNNLDLIVGSGWNTLGTLPNSFPFNGLIDEVAIYNRSLSSQEIREHYMRGSLKLNLSVRSCNDSQCSGENYTKIKGLSNQNLNIADNEYFQYKAEFTTENLTHSPKLYNLSVGYLATNAAPIVIIIYPINNSNYSFIQTAINYTVFDTEISSCWYSLDSGVTNSSIICGTNITGLSSSQGNNLWRVYANDTSGIERFSSTSFFIDSIPPSISITSPSNNSLLTNTTVFVNYTVSDSSGLSSCWWTNSSGVRNTSVSCGTNFSFIGRDGINLVGVYSNDTLGNNNVAFVTINVNTQAPSVSIVSPVEGSVVGNATNIPLNFSAIDTSLQSCWYTITNGFLNFTLPNCQNTTFNVNSDGLYEIEVYANDSNGNIGFDINSFTVSIDSPSITPISPIDSYFGASASNNISFVYAPTDLDLQSCALWTNANGSYSLNQTNYTITSGQQHFFNLNMSNSAESSYLWAIQCNDTLGHISLTRNQTFHIDRTRPAVILNEPTGTYSSLSNIPISLSYTDASPVQCIYNISFAATGNLVVGNSELFNCSPTTFTLDTESSYFLWMLVNDSAGNMNVSHKSFTVSIPSGGTPGGGSSTGGSSGGGGGSSITGRASFDLNFGSVDSLKIARGGSESIELSVKNSGVRFLNNCHFSTTGGVSDWVSGEDIQSLSPGQSFSYIFTVNVPIDAEVGTYFVSLGVNCVEYNKTFTYEIEVIGGEFELSILNSERIGTKLRASYSIENFGEKSKDLTVNYKLFNEDKDLIVEGSAGSFSIPVDERFENTIEFELPKNSLGDYSLVIEATDGLDISQKKQQVRLTTGGISGFAISDNNLRTIGWFGLVVILSFGIYLSIKTIRHQLAIKRANEDLDRQFISIDLDH